MPGENLLHCAFDSITFFAKDGRQNAAVWIWKWKQKITKCNRNKANRNHYWLVPKHGQTKAKSYLRVVKFQGVFGTVIFRQRIHRVLKINWRSLSRTKHKTNHSTETDDKKKITSAVKITTRLRIVFNTLDPREVTVSLSAKKIKTPNWAIIMLPKRKNHVSCRCILYLA